MTKTPKIKIRTAFDRERTVSNPGVVTMTQQHMKDECDINTIMKKYERDGIISHVSRYNGNYDDFTVLPDFKTALDTMRDAEEMFLTLPASIRDKFDNDPGQFVEFATDECNLGELHKLGLTSPDYVPPEVEKPKRSMAAENPAAKISEIPDQKPS